ncbi:TonB-dependent receptor [Flavisolibacter sp. BT320]|nr:TonB-dependent receptor [Flavisolibacter longurius]
MHTKFIILLQIFFSLSIGAQTIKGTVKTNKGTVISGATVSLMQATDSSLVKLRVSAEDGSFHFAATDTGGYLLSVSSVGYVTTYSPILQGRNGEQVIELILPETQAQMGAVVITAKKPLIQVKADRTVLNVEGTIAATGSTVLELLRKSPTVTVNSEDRISMAGKNDVQVYIDGRPLPLSSPDLAAYLKSMQSSEVEAIELITHPSAKFEAAGNAGIINIRMKKAKSYGTNGSATAGYNQGIYGKSNGTISLNHRTAKLNVFGNLGYNSGITHRALKVDRFLQDSLFAQHGTQKENSQTLNGKAGADFFINAEQTIGVLINGNLGTTWLTNNSYTEISALRSPPSRILKADNRFSSERDHLGLNLNYQYTAKAGRSLSLNADYGYYHLKGQQFQPNFYYDGSGRNLLKTVTYEMNTPTMINIYSAKADYEKPFAKGRLAVGGKSSYVTTDNDFQRYNVNPTGNALDYDRSNRFVYRESIHAAYLNYNRQWKNLQLQAGVRAENTSLDGTSTGQKWINGGYQPYDSTINSRYLNLFPSVAFTYSHHEVHQFSLTLSRRIDRPVYQDLNPFELKVDDYLVQRGNAWLRPQYTTGAGVGYVYKQKLNASLHYSLVKDLSAWLLDTTEGSRSVASKQNLASQKLWTLNLSYPFQHKAYAFFANMTGTYAAYQGDFGPGRRIDQKAFGINLFMQHSLKFAKAWTAELTGFYYSPSLQESNIRVQGFWSADAGVQTKLLHDKATVKLALSDVFNTLQFRSKSSFGGQVVHYNTKNETRQVKLSVSFRLGSNDVKSARQRKSGAEEEMKRVN